MNNRTFYKAFNKDILDSADLEKQHTEISSFNCRYILAQPNLLHNQYFIKYLKCERQGRVHIAIFRGVK